MSTTTPPVSVAVLDSAVTYTHATLQRARRSPLTLPTPCADWDLGTLLLHMEDSLATIGEAAELGRVDVADTPRRDGADRLVDRIVQRACVTRSAWLQRLTSAPIAVTHTDLVVRSNSVTPSSASNFLICVLSVGWPMSHAAAARPK